jgi:hypothetical protein
VGIRSVSGSFRGNGGVNADWRAGFPQERGAMGAKHGVEVCELERSDEWEITEIARASGGEFANVTRSLHFDNHICQVMRFDFRKKNIIQTQIQIQQGCNIIAIGKTKTKNKKLMCFAY